ncbi:hypothetical protein GU926_11960 [Nibribacter ruber]|uniref:Uncharacterized protein n=1 Tax=Nibribacter ruber TaxID=2698458 RepID=A0A6P1NWN6_9BACT|nr:hypothetical protein [Nibribacter ruber]QHL88107.1 hypothetical protein GU926_11960 [Nibribacter ruber]
MLYSDFSLPSLADSQIIEFRSYAIKMNFIPNQQARQRLAEKLQLPFSEDMKDWEYEVSDYKRMRDFIAEYDKLNTTTKERETLLEMVLDGLESLLEQSKLSEFEFYFPSVEERIKQNFAIHEPSLTYWTNIEFKISERLKLLLKTDFE